MLGRRGLGVAKLVVAAGADGVQANKAVARGAAKRKWSMALRAVRTL